jgi:hypothetical protein
MMHLPGFCAETAIGKPSRTYRSSHTDGDIQTVTDTFVMPSNSADDSFLDIDEAELAAAFENVIEEPANDDAAALEDSVFVKDGLNAAA